MYESNDKMVSHPPHYQSESGLEVIDVIQAFTADLKGIEATDTGNIIKYICRWKKKNGIEDLRKIMWYTQHLIDHLEKIKIEPAGKIGFAIDTDYQNLRNRVKLHALENIEGQLANGYLDIGDFFDACEIEVVSEAIKEYRENHFKGGNK